LRLDDAADTLIAILLFALAIAVRADDATDFFANF
jgi:hypothetical protein